MLIQLNISRLGQQKVILFLETDRVKKFLYSPTRIVEFVSEYIFLVSKNKQTRKKNKNRKKAKETKEENFFGKSIKKNKFAAARVKIFLITRISGNKRFLSFFFFFFFFFWPYCAALDSHILVAPNLIN